MKLIILYGAPATGKYTVGKELAKKTNLKFFHNHLSIDVAKSIFSFGEPGLFELSDSIRLDVFEEAAKQNVEGIIFTFVFRKINDHVFVQSITDTAKRCDIELQFIQLYCDKAELIKRVESQHRKEMKKLTNPDELLKMLEEGEFQSSISDVESIMVDSTHLTIEETVEKVFNLIQ